jgi:nucleotide-binding universal stress UspA family protein
VCPVEASNPTGPATVLGVTLARLFGGGLHLLHVPRARGEAVPAYVREWLAEPGGDDGIRLGRADACSDPADAIARYAHREGAALVVIDARYGDSRLWRRRRSWVARRLARLAPCPVLVVPAEGTGLQSVAYPPFREVVCAVDFSPASVAAARVALALAQGARGRLTLVHVLATEPQRMVFSGGEALRYLREYEARVAAESERLMRLLPVRERDTCRIEPFVITGAPHHMILRVASEAKANLIVLGVTPFRVAEELLAGSTSRAVLRSARCPVLLVRAPVAAGERRAAGLGWEGVARPQPKVAAMARRGTSLASGSVAALR